MILKANGFIVKYYMYRTDPYENLVIARLFDFFAGINQWHRRPWEPGTLMMIRELLEASEAHSAGVLTDGAVGFIKQSIMPIASMDKGIGTKLNLGKLGDLLKTDLEYYNYEYLQLKSWLIGIEGKYLENWSVALKVPADCPNPERTARAIGGHLLDLDFHPDFLHRWLNYLVRHDPAAPPLSEIVSAAHRLEKEKPKIFIIFVPFEHAQEVKPTKNILDLKTFDSELSRAGITKIGRHQGGLKLEITARDIFTAVEKAGEWIDSFKSRVIIGTAKTRVRISEKGWIQGEITPYPISRRERKVEVYELGRNDQSILEDKTHNLDAALDLLSPMTFSSPSSALVGGWAAIEGMLGTPGKDRGINAADRMATIVACSFPRAELTNLAYKVDKTSAERKALDACATTYDRVNLLAQYIKDGVALNFKGSEDQASFERMKALILDPKKKLEDIEIHLKRVFRRMYRLRNLILHWGKTDAVALRTGLRIVVPLVSEGMDRIVHAYFKKNLQPLELAALAKVRLSTIDPDEVKSITGLLN